MSSGAADFFGQGHGNGFRVNEAVSSFKIFTHARGVDLEIRRESGEVMEGAGSEADDFGESGPFGVPGAETALMFLRLCREHGGDETGNAICCGENGGARDGILFVRHGGRPATTGGVRFCEFTDFGLHVKREVVGDFVEGSGAESEC